MPIKFVLFVASLLTMTASGTAEEEKSAPVELSVLDSWVGVWDAEIEVWAGGLDAPPIKFEGVETNRAYGKHWIASDFDSEFMGQTVKVHSIVGYDLNKKKMVGTVIDHGPYSATMTGEYDEETKTLTWITKAQGMKGQPMIQKTTVTQKDANKRLLVLMVEDGKKTDKFKKFMKITFVKREPK